MKTKLHLLGMLLLTGSLSLTAQTTHPINWGMSTGAAATITINVGDAIEWTNVDAMNHNVVSIDVNAPVGFGSGTLGQNDTYLFTFNSAVVFDYRCSFHPGTMFGTITVLGGPSCDPPSGLSLVNITEALVEISWTASADETEGYSWVLMSLGDDPETDIPVTSGSVGTGVTTAEATGLAASTQYDFYVATECAGDETSDYAGPFTVTTDDVLGITDKKTTSFNFYPNPATDIVYIEAGYSIESVSVVNSLGQRVILVEQLNTKNIKIDVSKLENGAYFIKVNAKDNSGVYKLLKK